MVSTGSTSANVAGRGNKAFIPCDQESIMGSPREANFNLYKKCLGSTAMLQPTGQRFQ